LGTEGQVLRDESKSLPSDTKKSFGEIFISEETCDLCLLSFFVEF